MLGSRQRNEADQRRPAGAPSLLGAAGESEGAANRLRCCDSAVCSGASRKEGEVTSVVR